MASHDFYYQMSDDHQKFMRGNQSLKEITSYREKVGESAYIQLWNEYAPKTYQIEVDAETKANNAMKWIDYLKTTGRKQGRDQLGDSKKGFCCLGIGCKVLGIGYIIAT